MRKRDQYKRLIMFFASAVILLIQTGIYAYVWYSYYANAEVLLKPFWERGNYVVIALYGAMVFFFYKIYGGFKVGYLRIFEVLYSQIISVLCVNSVTYLQLCLIGHWKFLDHVKPIIQMTLIDIIVICIWVVIMRWIYIKIYPPRKLMMVYGQYSPDGLIYKFSKRDDKYTIEEQVSVDVGIEEIQKKLVKYNGVILTDIPVSIRNKILKFCYLNNIRCYCVPKITDIMIKSASEIHLFDTSLLLLKNNGLTMDQLLLKRLFDIVFALVAILVSLPVMLIIALAIKIYDGGPILFTQDRLTKDGEIFRLYKFRSMRVADGDDEYCMTRKNDDRITPVGKLIRNIHFDELPQIFNILKGDMSFVGPRPECPELAAEYCRILPEFSMRLKVKAGLTGFAQVYGKYNTTPYDKLKLDLTYIENYSFLLDLQLIMLTFKVLFQRENTEGIEDWQKSAADPSPKK